MTDLLIFQYYYLFQLIDGSSDRTYPYCGKGYLDHHQVTNLCCLFHTHCNNEIGCLQEDQELEGEL